MSRTWYAGRARTFLVGITLAALLLLGWQLASADAPIPANPIQAQVKQVLPSLRDSEAEYANGAYIPGVGGFYTIDLIRGPNAVKGLPSYQGTRDWAIYLMQTFGPKLDKIPRTETIAISVDFYDYSIRTNRQLVVTCLAADAATPAKYAVFLDGQPYTEVATQTGAASQAATGNRVATPASAAPATPAAKPTASGSSTPAGSTVPAPGVVGGTTKAPTPTAGPYSGTLSFADPQSAKDWFAVTGQWEIANGSYIQKDEGKFDLLALYNRRLVGDYRMQVELRYLKGEMGGGVVFNVPSDTGKQGAQMVSYTAGGKFVHWGYFDNNGVFQYQGGAGVPNGADGKPHTLAIQVSGKTYAVVLDGVQLGVDLPLAAATPGYVGLAASTSQVQFDNFTVESK